MNKLLRTIFVVGVATTVGMPSAWAGPIVIDGTDANDHGSSSGTANLEGWLYMEKVLNNLAPQVGNGNKSLVILGTHPGTDADSAISSAFSKSNIGSIWQKYTVNGATNIGDFLSGKTVNNISLAQTGILYISTNENTSGDLTDAELAAINSNAAAIANFVGGAGKPNQGGGLFTQAESPNTGTSYDWLSSLIPGLKSIDGGGSAGLSLTSSGTNAFPGLTNTDLSAGPWHNYFTGNLGSLQVLATGNASDGTQNAPVIIGGGAGTVINASPPPVVSAAGVPEPSATSGLLAFLGLAARFLWKRQQQ